MLRLASARLTVDLSPEGARLTAALRDGRGFLAPQACFPLLPLGNRVEGNGFVLNGRHHRFQPNTDEPFYLHGDGWQRPWQVIAASDQRVRLAMAQTAPAASPHVYRAEMTVALRGSTLAITLGLVNHGPEAMPFGLGLHPFFPRSPATRVTALAKAWWAEGPGLLPAARGALPASADFTRPAALPDHRLNNAYEGWSGLARIDWPETRLRLEMTADPLFAHLMAYAPAEDKSFFCLEPMSHLPNALALQGPQALRILAPGQGLSGRIIFRLSDLE